jgi:hypothetical protein
LSQIIGVAHPEQQKRVKRTNEAVMRFRVISGTPPGIGCYGRAKDAVTDLISLLFVYKIDLYLDRLNIIMLISFQLEALDPYSAFLLKFPDLLFDL